jgi:hypothetical protein
MRLRDTAIVAAVLLVGGFAAADALRGDAEPDSPAGSAASSPAVTEETLAVETETVVGVAQDVLEGRLVFTDEQCALRELDLEDGTLLRHRTVRSSCGLVAAPRGTRVALTLPSRRRDTVPYQLLDLADPGAELPPLLASIRTVVWSADGRRVAWCAPSGRVGHELELGDGSALVSRQLRACPFAYTPSGVAVYVEGRRLVAAGDVLLEAPEAITAASFAARSLALATRSQLLLYVDAPGARPESYGRLVHVRAIPGGLRGLRVAFSPRTATRRSSQQPGLRLRRCSFAMSGRVGGAERPRPSPGARPRGRRTGPSSPSPSASACSSTRSFRFSLRSFSG